MGKSVNYFLYFSKSLSPKDQDASIVPAYSQQSKDIKCTKETRKYEFL